MSSNVEVLKERITVAEAEREYYASLVDAFFTGEAPSGGNFNHFIMAQWGRKRLEQKNEANRAVLLGGKVEQG